MQYLQAFLLEKILHTINLQLQPQIHLAEMSWPLDYIFYEHN